MATIRTRWPDSKMAAEKVRRGIIDGSTATPDMLDVPDQKILKVAGRTAEEARRLVRDAEAVAAQQNGTGGRRAKQHSESWWL